MSQPRRAPLAGYMPDRFGCPMGALHFKSEKAQPAWLPCSYLGQLIVFLWKWNLLVLVPEPEQPSRFDTSPVTLALFSQHAVLVCATI